MRKYTGYKDMPRVNNGLGIAIISTSKGVMTNKEAAELKNIRQVKGEGENIQYTADRITVNPGTYNIFAIANGKAITRCV